MSRPAKPLRVLAYVRVSGAEQGRTGTSLEAQREEIERHCRLEGLPAPALFVEVESAGAEKLERRAELRRLMADVRPGDLVMVAKQDRWSRDTLFYLQSTRDIVARGARFFSLAERFDPETSEGRFASTLMAAVAEQERDRIRARTVGRRAELREQGRYVEGLVPIGYRRGKGNILEIVEADAAIVREAFARCAAGMSLRKLAEHLQVEFPERSAWAKSHVRDILDCRTHLGEVRTSKGWIAAHEPIITREQWERAHAALASRRLGGRPATAEARTAAWLLRGLASCVCGARMSAAYSREADYYACSRRLRGQPCDAGYLRVDRTDAEIAPLALERLRELRAALKAPTAGPAPAARDDSKLRAKLTRRRERLIDLAADGAITGDDLRARLAELDGDVGRLDVAAADARRAAQAQQPERRRELLTRARALDVAWGRMPVSERRTVLGCLASAIVIQAGKAPRITWRTLEELSISTGWEHKCARPFREAEFDIRWGTGIDAAADLIDYAMMLGVVEKNGSHLSFGGEHLGQGRERARDAVLSKGTLAGALRSAVEAAAPTRPIMHRQEIATAAE